jgi:chromosome segregation ATPase
MNEDEANKVLDYLRGWTDRHDALAFEREQRWDVRFDKLEARFDAVDGRFASVETRLDKVEARIDRLTITVEKLAENVAALDSSMVGVLQHVSNANAAHARTAREIDELRARIEALEQRQ